MEISLIALKMAKINKTKGVNSLSNDITWTQQQRPKLPTVTLTWQVSNYRVYKHH